MKLFGWCLKCKYSSADLFVVDMPKLMITRTEY